MKKKYKIIFVLVVIIGIVFLVFSRGKTEANVKVTVSQALIRPTKKDVSKQVSTTGTVQPQNRLEVQPPISGRIETVLVQEGDRVKSGEIIAWMSSTDRAALLDTARAKGAEELAYWSEVYKAAPLVAPMDGTVIVRSVEPGQTITTSDTVVVLSDRLVVEAEVDETDIGGIKKGQRTSISLDAYPEITVEGVVDHVSYESVVVNNVTIYEVDIVPSSIPEVFRSGMSANLEIVVEESKNALVVPSSSVQKDKKGNYVLVGDVEDPVKQRIEIGMSDDDSIEVVSGLSVEDEILVEVKKYDLAKKGGSSTSPFMPKFGRKMR